MRQTDRQLPSEQPAPGIPPADGELLAVTQMGWPNGSFSVSGSMNECIFPFSYLQFPCPASSPKTPAHLLGFTLFTWDITVLCGWKQGHLDPQPILDFEIV